MDETESPRGLGTATERWATAEQDQLQQCLHLLSAYRHQHDEHADHFGEEVIEKSLPWRLATQRSDALAIMLQDSRPRRKNSSSMLGLRSGVKDTGCCVQGDETLEGGCAC